MYLNNLIEKLESISDGYAQKFNIQRTDEWFLLKLTEELGELVQSYLHYCGQARTSNSSSPELKVAFEDELADVLGMTLLVAHHHQVDLETAVSRKWLQYLNEDSNA